MSAPGTAAGPPGAEGGSLRFGRVLVVWLALAVAMVVQGAAREALLTPTLGPLRAHQVSCLTGSLIVILGSAAALGWLGAVGNVPLQIRIGGAWLALTIVFEFVFGHYVFGHSWERLLYDYNVVEGRLWALVLVATFLGPAIAGRFVGPRPPP